MWFVSCIESAWGIPCWAICVFVCEKSHICVKLRTFLTKTGYKIAICNLRIANCELRIANCELRFVICVFQILWFVFCVFQYICIILHKFATVKLDTFLQFVICDLWFVFFNLLQYLLFYPNRVWYIFPIRSLQKL